MAAVKAITFQGVERVAYADVPEPRIEAPGDAVVRVRLAGLCGSDLHVFHGREQGLDVGTVMGHEMVGEVVEVGSAVSTLAVGRRVVAPFSTCCGDCFYCRAGLQARCERGQLFGWVEGGVGLHGCQAEACRVPLADATLVPVPDAVDDESALLAADVLATGFFAAESAGVGTAAAAAASDAASDTASNTVAVVVGCGPVGLCAAVACRQLGAQRVFALDPVARRREQAAAYGATALDPSGEDGEAAALALVRDATGGRGADAVIEAVGSPAATRLAVDLARPGATVAAVGVHHESGFAFTPVEAYDKNLTYRAGRCPARRYLPRLLALLAAEPDLLPGFVSHRMPLAAGAEAYELFASRRESCTKVALVPDSAAP